jgi:hypothetical protein
VYSVLTLTPNGGTPHGPQAAFATPWEVRFSWPTIVDALTVEYGRVIARHRAGNGARTNTGGAS